jgi:hypothetical protein
MENPQECICLCKLDVVVDKNRIKMGIGVVVRDEMREVLATLLAPRDHTSSSLILWMPFPR